MSELSIDLQLNKAEQNIMEITKLVRSVKLNFLELGKLLIENKENSYHDAMQVGFKDFCEMLGLGSYSWITRLMDISRLVAHNILTEGDVLDIGVAKTCLLLPRAKRDGKVDEEILARARQGCPYHDLRVELGQAKDEEFTEYINCPHCGADFPFKEYMIKRR